jgi:hypothetical protein
MAPLKKQPLPQPSDARTARHARPPRKPSELRRPSSGKRARTLLLLLLRGPRALHDTRVQLSAHASAARGVALTTTAVMSST